MPIIQVDHLTKEYRLGAMKGLKQTLLNGAARLTGKKIEAPPLFKALDDVSFSIEPGEVVGIIGHNGAGKSTLLKMLAKISTPTHGSVKVDGRIAPLIEVGAGFVPDFTGRENVYLNGAILGLSRQEVDKKFDEIVDFAEMAEFIDTPVKRYSSGMQVKLAFAVATSVDAEILIVDEVLAVGDLAFQRKCFDRMEKMIKRQGRTVLLVSHNIRQVERMCSRVFMLDHGRVVVEGESQKVCNAFYEYSDQKINIQANYAQNNNKSARSIGSGELDLIEVKILDEFDNEVRRVKYLSAVSVMLYFKANSELKDLAIGVGVHTPDMIFVANDDSSITELRSIDFSTGDHVIIYLIPEMILLPGVYSLRVGVAPNNTDRVLFYGDNLYSFEVYSDSISRSRTVNQGFVSFGGKWVANDF
jgi:lipopolysaccharide transport system ATP-binding protein